MKEEDKNKNLRSRREFFKKAAKGVLPLLGVAALISAPKVAKAAETPQYCQWDCTFTCRGGCQGCTGACTGGCRVAVIQHALVLAEGYVLVDVEIFVFMVTNIDNQLL